MSRSPQQKAAELLSIPERLIAATVGVALLSVAVVVLVWPPYMR